MNLAKKQKYCLECNKDISYNEVNYSIEKFNIPLCIGHQEWLSYIQTISTPETIRLYFALKMRGVPAEIEKNDGFKSIDIAITEARINIEVDGGHHNYSNQQALSDLKRTYFSYLKGYYTIRIPNSLVNNDYVLNETADYIVGILNESLNKNYAFNSDRG